ncbi:MAG: YHS domain-containing (seleno)protein [Verrucomicrobiota bacterium]
MKKLLFPLFLILAQAASAIEPINETFFGGVAIKGYDPVAYFVDDKPLKGSKEFQTEWNGAKWRFANEENLKAFEEDPEKYAPQFGGYCAWAVSQGYTADIDPEAWTIVDGKLYLNYNKEIQERWEADKENFIKKGAEEWEKLKPKD